MRSNAAALSGENGVRTGASPVVVIPAYEPGRPLPQLVRELMEMPGIGQVVVVDDGSGPGYRSLFLALRRIPGVHLLTHAENQGKGAALKTGLEYAAR